MQLPNRWQFVSALVPFLTCVVLALVAWAVIGIAALLLGPLTIDLEVLLALTLVAAASSLTYGVAAHAFRRSPFAPLLVAVSTGVCTALSAITAAAYRGVSYGIVAGAGLALLFTVLTWLVARRARA